MKKSFFKIGLGLLVASSLSLNANGFNDNTFDEQMKQMQKIFQSMNDNFFGNTHGHGMMNLHENYPKVNIVENKDNYVATFELAGMEKKDIKVYIQDNSLLIVEGKKEQKTNTKETKDKQQTVVNELYYGSFKRVITLPEDADIKKLDVNFKNSVLTVTIAKDKNYNQKNIKLININ